MLNIVCLKQEPNKRCSPGDALKAIYQVTQGVPRLINLLCERCLVGAFSQQNLP